MNLEPDVPLAPFTTIGIGGPASWMARVATPHVAAELFEFSERESVPLCVMGGGSNMLVSDQGFPGLVLRMVIPGIDVDDSNRDRPLLIAGGGVEWDSVVSLAVESGFQGMECLSGIPGSVGAAPMQNIGAYGQEVSETIEWVEVMDRETRKIFSFPGSECGFRYRNSRFKGSDRHRFLILRVAFRLARDDKGTVRYADLVRDFHEAGIAEPTLQQVRDSVIRIRAGKGMFIDSNDPESRSCGSFFMNPVVTTEEYETILEKFRGGMSDPGERIPAYPVENGSVKLSAAWLMEHSGLKKGQACGTVGLGRRHILAIVNRGDGKASDVMKLVEVVQSAVMATFGVRLHPEPVLVGFEG